MAPLEARRQQLTNRDRAFRPGREVDRLRNRLIDQAFPGRGHRRAISLDKTIELLELQSESFHLLQHPNRPALRIGQFEPRRWVALGGRDHEVEGDEIREMAKTGEAHSWTLEADPVIVAVGRLTPQKGYSFLLRALSIVRTARPVRLVIFGVGELQEQLAAETARLDLAGAVNWAGFSSNPFPTIRAANAYVMPSLWEGFPVALLEAMALEQAVIATDCPGASSEMLRGGKSGLLVPSRDPAALAEAILAVVSDPALRRDLGARARKRAGEYSAEEVFHRYHTVMLGTLE